MPMPVFKSPLLFSGSTLATFGFSIVAAFVAVMCLPHDGTLRAQEAAEEAQPAPRPKKPAPKPAPKPVPKEKVEKPAPTSAAASPATPDLAVKLRENGAGTCAAQINAVAAETMGGVSQFNSASHWPTGASDRRLVGVSIGQKYPDGNNVPYAATNVLAAPNPQGGCDAFAFQVLPSPLSCAKLRESLMANGRLLGDLAGIPLMQDAGGQSMLIPAPANTCVLIGIKTAYVK